MLVQIIVCSKPGPWKGRDKSTDAKEDLVEIRRHGRALAGGSVVEAP